MSNAAIAERPAQAPATVEQHPASDSTALMQMIERVAMNPNADITKMQQLLDMRERLEAKEHERAFNQAMTAAQAEMSSIGTNKRNDQTKSDYATYDKLDKVLRPLYIKHNFALSFDTAEGAPPDHVRVVAHVSHADGHTRTYHVDMPNDGKGAKGGDVMTKTHATGAAMTYGMRYLLKMIFNVAIGGDDNDGNDVGALVTAEQVKTLKELIDKAVASKPGTDHAAWIEQFLGYMKVDALNSIRAKDFEKGRKAIVNATNEGKKNAR